MRRLTRSARSEEDLIAIWRFVATENRAAATRLLQHLDQRIQSLATYPFIGEQQSQFGETTRRIVIGNYLVFYDVLPDAVHVLRIFHSARRFEELLN